MGWNVEIISVEDVRDFSYESILAKYERDIQKYGYKQAYCEISKNYDCAIEAVKRTKSSYDKFMFQLNESFKIIVATYMVIDYKKGDTDCFFLFYGVSERVNGEYVYHSLESKEYIDRSVDRSMEEASKSFKKKFGGNNEALQVFIEGKDGKVSALREFADKLIILAEEFMQEYERKYGSVDSKEVYKEIFSFAEDIIRPNPKVFNDSKFLVELEGHGIFNWSRFPDMYTVGFEMPKDKR